MKYLEEKEEELVVRKQYEAPMAEKLDFNYLENVVASYTPPEDESGILKRQSGGNNGCYDGNKNGTTGCIPRYT